MANVKWIKLKDFEEMYSACECVICGRQRNLLTVPQSCWCGCNEFSATQSAVTDLLKGRTKNLVCVQCETDLSDEYVTMYPHDNGWVMEGVDLKWWMSIECPECRYHTSFDKFGIPK